MGSNGDGVEGTAVLVGLVELALLGLVFVVVRAFAALVVEPLSTPIAVSVACVLVLSGLVLGRGAGLSTTVRLTAYLSAITSVALLFLGFVWVLVFVLVGLPLGGAIGFTVAGAVVLGLGCLVLLVVVSAIRTGTAARNWALTLRMVAALTLLSLCTVVFFALVWLVVLVASLLVFEPAGAAMVSTLLAIGLLGWFVYRQVGRGSLEERADAELLTGESYPDLQDRVTRVAAQLGIPAPEIAISEREAPEAMAVGVRPASSHLILSTGTLSALDDEQLTAVIAHELAHVANRDAMVMTVASIPVVVVDGIRAELLGNLPDGPDSYNDIETTELWGENQEWRITEPGPIERRLTSGRVGVVGWLLAAVGAWTSLALIGEGRDMGRENLPVRLAISVIVVGLLLSWLVSRIIVAVFSRARETVADRTAAQITGSPAALAGALRALDDQIESTPTEDLRQVSSVSSLSILPFEEGLLARTHVGMAEPPDLIQWARQKLFGTHPPTEDRIRALEEMATEQERE